MTPLATVLQGDALTVLADMPENSVDAIVTDPPYALGFMGKEWDSFGDTGRGARTRTERASEITPAGQGHSTSAGPYLAAGVDSLRSAGMPFQRWSESWAIEAIRVLKPGAHVVAFGGTRTHHRLMCALEDAGFEIRDCLMLFWLFGAGFPKSLDVGKALDRMAGAERSEVVGVKPGHESFVHRQDAHAAGGRADGWDRPWKDDPEAVARSHQQMRPATPEAQQWDGWGTALKPAYEPIVLARKPLSEKSVAANVLKWGTGGLNIDGCRIDLEGIEHHRTEASSGLGVHGIYGASTTDRLHTDGPARYSAKGRWPANVVLDEDAAQLLDAQTGVRTSGASPTRRGSSKSGDVFHGFSGQEECVPTRASDTGGPSRFFYTAKASRAERGEDNTHPTVKPLSLMRWLVRLVAPPNGLILDPFAGSGTTGLAAIAEGTRVVLIERDPEYVRLIHKRLAGVTAPLPLYGTEEAI